MVKIELSFVEPFFSLSVHCSRHPWTLDTRRAPARRRPVPAHTGRCSLVLASSSPLSQAERSRAQVVHGAVCAQSARRASPPCRAASSSSSATARPLRARAPAARTARLRPCHAVAHLRHRRTPRAAHHGRRRHGQLAVEPLPRAVLLPNRSPCYLPLAPRKFPGPSPPRIDRRTAVAAAHYRRRAPASMASPSPAASRRAEHLPR